MNLGTIRQNIAPSQNFREDLKKFYDKPVTKVSFELILSIFTVVLFAFVALRPTLNTMSQLLKEIEDKQTIDEGLTRKIAALSTAQEEYLTYETRFNVLNEVVHETPSVENVLFYLEYLVQREGIGISGLSIEEFPVNLPTPTANEDEATARSARAPQPKLTAYPVQVSFSGEYGDILRFFQTIESVRPLFVIESFTFQVQMDVEQEGRPELLVSTKLLMYAYSTDQVPADATTRPAPAADADADADEELL